MPICESERGMLTPDEPGCGTDTRTPAEVVGSSISKTTQLFEHIENLMFEGATELELEGNVYNIARDKDDRDEIYVLTPKN
jgi:hypothetical protein